MNGAGKTGCPKEWNQTLPWINFDFKKDKQPHCKAFYKNLKEFTCSLEKAEFADVLNYTCHLDFLSNLDE